MADKIADLIQKEEKRQKETLMLIPSENYTYPQVRDAVGSFLMHKYSEGYPSRRYYQGNKYIDKIEKKAINEAKKLFGVPHANVQPYSGSPANSAVYFALVPPGAKIMGMKLSVGGHLTHGHPDITFSGKYYKSVQFGVGEDGRIDYEKVAQIAKSEKPKLMLIGTTSYPLIFDWEKFGEIADDIGAFLVSDISHVAGLVAGGVYPDPVPYAHVVTSTTHKSLRGPRGALILVTEKGIKKDTDLASKIDRAVFPGLQGGPHNNTTAGIAISLQKAKSPEFCQYAEQIVKNAIALARELRSKDIDLYTGGTECHLLVIDLRSKGISGNVVAESLEAAGIIVNKNSVPNDPEPPFYPSGIRLGTPAVTARGMGESEMQKVADWIKQTIEHVKDKKLPRERQVRKEFLKKLKTQIYEDEYLKDIQNEVKTLCKKFPIK